MLFFYHASKVKQSGTVTRVASGCSKRQVKALRKLHDEITAPMSMSNRFNLHFAPACPDNRSKYFNKPYGLLNWMEKVLGYPDSTQDNDIIVVVDPDMMLLRPLTHEFDVDSTSWVVDSSVNDGTVRNGYPIAQAYDYGSNWLTSLQGNISYVAGDVPTRVQYLNASTAELYYPAGPPYLATARDMYNIARHWSDFCGRLHNIFPHMMSEMHAYSFAAAHLQLPHRLARSFMISDASSEREGWGFLQHIKRNDACLQNAIPSKDLPFVLHYCHRYAVGRWFIGKVFLPEKFLKCRTPLLREPPLDVAMRYDWRIYPGQRRATKNTKSLHNAWALCRMIFALNLERSGNLLQEEALFFSGQSFKIARLL